MHLLSVIVIGVASNLDNLGIGVSFGMRATRIPFLSNLLIAFISMSATYLSCLAGQVLAQVIAPAVANVLGGGMLVLLGIWSMVPKLGKTEEQPECEETSGGNLLVAVVRKPTKADVNEDHVISAKESIFLGLALAVNCLACGFGGGVTGMSPLETALSVGAFSLLTVDVGVRAGYSLAKLWMGQSANLLSGLILIAIGIYEIIV